MQKDKKLLPIGINRFEDLRLGPFYYIDKTVFIYEIPEICIDLTQITNLFRFSTF